MAAGGTTAANRTLDERIASLEAQTLNETPDT
jgi:hypothetical protein